MAREDWRDREEERRLREPLRERDDLGQADYSTEYGYDPARPAGYRAQDDVRPASDDYRRADYPTDRADYPTDRPYDRERGPYSRSAEQEGDYGRRMDTGDYRPTDAPPRSWLERAGAVFGGGGAPREHDRPREHEAARRRRGPSDRVLWAVIVERLEAERRIDLRDVDVVVQDGEVTLNGMVRRKEDKRRIEDVADIDGVHHVQNNLCVRGRDHWTFL
jgi:hypothetical protein